MSLSYFITRHQKKEEILINTSFPQKSYVKSYPPLRAVSLEYQNQFLTCVCEKKILGKRKYNLSQTIKIYFFPFYLTQKKIKSICASTHYL